MGRFVEDLKWGGLRYAIDSANNARRYDEAMRALSRDVKQASVDDLMDQINQKLELANQLTATLAVGNTANVANVTQVKNLISEILELINKLQNTTDKCIQFVMMVIKATQTILAIIETVSKVA